LAATLSFTAGCSDDKASDAADNSHPPAAGAQSESAAPVPADAIKVEMGEFHFGPSNINAKPGKVTFNLVNMGAVPHDLVINGPSGPLNSPQVDAGGQKLWQVDLQPGTYEAICSLPGHASSGMKATVVVQ
jgi:plastocyanin